MQNIYEAIAVNKRKSTIVMIAFVVFVGIAIWAIANGMSYYFGYEPGGLGFIGIAFVISGAMSFVGYYTSDKIILGISGAREADRKKDFQFYTVAENLSIAAGVPKPKLYVIDDTAPNAFATGRDPKHAVICATRGLLDNLNRTELEGVIAHEMSHIRNYDTRLLSIVAVLVGLVALLGDWFLRMSFFGSGRRSRDNEGGQIGALLVVVGFIFALLSPIIATLIQLAISRRREFLADVGSVSLTRQPSGLISALEKISRDREPLEVANKATAHLYIVNPFKGEGHGSKAWFANLFNTHPPIAERVKALQKMV